MISETCFETAVLRKSRELLDKTLFTLWRVDGYVTDCNFET